MGGTVLLVEDNEELQYIIARALILAGYTVLCADDPSAAIAHVRESAGKAEPIVAMITDHNMPLGNDGLMLNHPDAKEHPGIALAKLLRAGVICHPETGEAIATKQIPIIVQTNSPEIIPWAAQTDGTLNKVLSKSPHAIVQWVTALLEPKRNAVLPSH